MALNAVAFNAMFDTLRPNSIHGFDETGNLKEFVANEPLFVYEGGGVKGTVTCQPFVNLLTESDATLSNYYTNSASAQAGAAGLTRLIGYSTANGSGNRVVYRNNALSSILEEEWACVHLIVKMVDNSEPNIGTSSGDSGADIAFVMFNSLSTELVYKQPVADNAWYYIIRKYKAQGTAGVYAGVIQYGNYTGKPYSAAVVAVTRGQGWAPFFPFSVGEQTASGRTIYQLKGNNAEAFGARAIQIKGSVVPYAVSDESSDGSGAAFGWQYGYSATDRISFGVRYSGTVNDGWHALFVNTGFSTETFYGSDFSVELVFGQESGFELYWDNETCSVSVDGQPAVVRQGDFITDSTRNLLVLGTRVSTDRILNGLITEFELTAT